MSSMAKAADPVGTGFHKGMCVKRRGYRDIKVLPVGPEGRCISQDDACGTETKSYRAWSLIRSIRTVCYRFMLNDHDV